MKKKTNQAATIQDMQPNATMSPSPRRGRPRRGVCGDQVVSEAQTDRVPTSHGRSEQSDAPDTPRGPTRRRGASKPVVERGKKDQIDHETQCSFVDVSALCDQLVLPSRVRRSAIKRRLALENSVAALARVLLGYNPSANTRDKENGRQVKTKANAAIAARASAMLDAIKSGTPCDEPADVVHAVTMDWMTARPSIEACEQIERDAARTMKKIASKLPAFEWVKRIKGFGECNFASIIAETGNLSNYASVPRVWKRLGLGVIRGEAQGHPTDKSADVWIEHGYCKRRRTTVYQLQLCLKMNRSNPYHAIYEKRKLVELANTEVKSAGHAENRAMRYMVKRCIADLWGAWNNKPRPEVAA